MEFTLSTMSVLCIILPVFVLIGLCVAGYFDIKMHIEISKGERLRGGADKGASEPEIESNPILT